MGDASCITTRRGFGERGSGLQEQVLFDSANIPYLNAENYYDRDFLETYHQASKEYYLVPIQDGFQYVLNFEGIEDEVRETVQEAYRQLGINAKACRFSPADLPAVITAVSSDRPKEEDHDVRTPEGRQKLIETLAKQEALVRVDSGYTLCVNLTNTMVGDVIDRILRGGSLAPYRLALRLIYNSAVILFGEPSNREMARVVASGNTLMQSYLTTLDNLDSERERFRRLLASRDDIIEKLEGEVETFRESIKRTDAEAEARKAAETNRVFLSYSYHEDDEVLADGLRELLTSKDFVVTDGKASRLGRIGENILEKIKSSGYFVAIMTKRIEIQGESFTTSPWFLEEKGVALGAGKIAVLMVEEGVGEEFAGKLQGDLQRFHFNRGKDFMSRSLKVADLMVRHREKVLAELSGESGD